MILVDTSIWVDHLRKSNRDLVYLLEQSQVLVHPWIIGELVCGNLANRKDLLMLFSSMPAVRVVSDVEVFELIEARRLFGKAVGWVDMHLLAAAIIEDIKLWTGDNKLKRIAASLGVAF